MERIGRVCEGENRWKVKIGRRPDDVKIARQDYRLRRQLDILLLLHWVYAQPNNKVITSLYTIWFTLATNQPVSR